MADGAGSNGHDAQGRFTAGNPGGPGGARRRADEFRRAAEGAGTPQHIEGVMRRATRMALEGNLPAIRFVMDRTCGRPAEAPIEAEPLGISLPRLKSAADCNLAIQQVVDGICNGTIDRDAAKLLIDAVQARLKAIETQELEARLAELE